MSKDKLIIYNRETLFSSIVADCVTFGFLIGLMFLNFDYWGGHWYVTIVILILWIMSAAAKGDKRIHRFHGIDECIAYLQSQKQGSDLVATDFIVKTSVANPPSDPKRKANT